MSNILNEIAEYTKERVKKCKEKISLEEIKAKAYKMPIDKSFPFEEALRKDGISFICECKKASPSKGIIAEHFPYLEIAKEYEKAGASCISVLTEPKWFLGNNEYLKTISNSVRIPCLRKDFVVDEYMIYEAKVLGAKAVLLICSILSIEQMKKYFQICEELGLSALCEAHNEAEIAMAISIKARIIGVNNRNLKDFTVDVSNSQRMRELVPDNVLFVAESGIKTHADIEILEKNGVNAVLIGETMMLAKDKEKMLKTLRDGE